MIFWDTEGERTTLAVHAQAVAYAKAKEEKQERRKRFVRGNERKLPT